MPSRWSRSGEFNLRGFQRSVAAFNVIAVREPADELSRLLER